MKSLTIFWALEKTLLPLSTFHSSSTLGIVHSHVSVGLCCCCLLPDTDERYRNSIHHHHDISIGSTHAEHSLRHYTLQRHEPQGSRQAHWNHGLLHIGLQRTLRRSSRDEQTHARRHHIRKDVSRLRHEHMFAGTDKNPGDLSATEIALPTALA